MAEEAKPGRRHARDRVLQVKLVTEGVEEQSTLKIATVREVTGARPRDSMQLFVDFHGIKAVTVDLSFMLAAPELARPFADAFAHWGSSSPSAASIHSYRHSLKDGFFRFLVSERLTQLSLATLDNKLLSTFLDWLGRLVKNDDTPVSAITMMHYRSALKAVVDALMQLPGHRASINEHLSMPPSPWTRLSVPTVSTEPLDREAEQILFDACWSEVQATMARVRQGQDALAEAENRPSHLPPLTYRDFGFCLLELKRLHPHIVPVMRSLNKTAPTLSYHLQQYHGYKKTQEYLYPSQAPLVPFIVLLALQTGYNRDVLLRIKLSDIVFEDVLGEQRVLLRPYKGRSRAIQPQSFVLHAEPHEPGSLVPFLIEWTRRIRPAAIPATSELLFLYVSFDDPHPIGFMPGVSGHLWEQALKRFIRKHDLKRFSLRTLRATRAENVRLVSNGDPEAVRIALGQKNIDTQHLHYRSQAEHDRADERFAQLVNLHGRWVGTHGAVDPSAVTPTQQEWGATTPGFTCLDPYTSPVAGEQKGRLCRAYGACPTCPMAMVDLLSPHALVRLLQFKVTVAEAQRDLPPEMWLTVWAPIFKKLTEYWIPAFDDPEVIKAAERLSLPALPRLSTSE